MGFDSAGSGQYVSALRRVYSPTSSGVFLLQSMPYSKSAPCRLGIEEFLPPRTGEGSVSFQAARSWRSSELRLKGFDDLHALWFVLLKERNMLETERIKARAMSEHMENPARLRKVRVSMARLKTILQERRKEWQAAEKEL